MPSGMAVFQTLREGVTSLLIKKIRLRGHIYVLYFRYIRRPVPSHLDPNFQEMKAWTLDTTEYNDDPLLTGANEKVNQRRTGTGR